MDNVMTEPQGKTMKQLTITIDAPAGFEFVGDMPRSAMHDDNSFLVRFDIKPIEQAEQDPYTELNAQYERDVKKKPFFIGKYEVPPPVTEPLQDGQEYWTIGAMSINISHWEGFSLDNKRLSLGLIRLTESDARQCHEALVKTMRGE